MKDNTPYNRAAALYSIWPVVILLLFFGGAISLWDKHHLLAIMTGLIGIFIYWTWTKVRTKMIHEELSFRQLFRNW